MAAENEQLADETAALLSGDLQLLYYERCKHKICAVPPDAIREQNLNGMRAVEIALRAAPQIALLRDEMLELGDGIDLQAIDDIEPLAFAYRYSRIAFASANQNVQRRSSAYTEGLKCRETMRRALVSLAKSGSISDVPRPALKFTHGYVNLANTLSLQSHVLLERWDESGHELPFGRAVPQRAAELSSQLLDTLGKVEVSPRLEAATLLRAQAFTLLYDAYNEARRVVTFLRWHHGDAEVIAPSFYAKKLPSQAGIRHAQGFFMR